MTFEQALTALKAGKTVRRRGWQDLAYSKERFNGEVYGFDILADDWEIVDEPQPEPTIEELRRAIVAIVDCIPAEIATAKVYAAARVLRRPGDE